MDFKQAYAWVRRDLLWDKLVARGFGGEWLQAVQALYADVPMAVRTAAGVSPCFQARIGRAAPSVPRSSGCSAGRHRAQAARAR